ncbi:hypothetical protein JRQ81_004194 [Phrynocephalus forsythii]|uniref:Uncharacterized protein n=1 Tax=Phrynocephalus forsythii TaxID=171643 RepID=A0A9Q0Y2P6_9SAUR|nr:hypothetical protein JRQ81_004194 [Phrynocephalus forsythii]
MCRVSRHGSQQKSSSKVNENPQMIVTDQHSSAGSAADLTLGREGFQSLELGISEEIPQTSRIQNIDAELKLLNESELDSYNVNNEREMLASSQPKDAGDFNVVGVQETAEMQNECLTNVTLISSTVGPHEQVDEAVTCGTKDSGARDSQVEGDLSSISFVNIVKPSSNEELMVIKNTTHGSSGSDVELSYIKGTDLTETKNTGCSSVQPEMIEESLDSAPLEITVGNLGNKALPSTDMSSEAFNNSADGDFTYSELNFDQPNSFPLNSDMEHDRGSLKSDEIHSTDPPKLKSSLEIQTIDFSLGDIEVEHEQLGLLPSDILHEETVNSPTLASVVPVCLDSSKIGELGIDQPIGETEMIDFAALTSGIQEDKFCPLVYDVIDPHVISPSNDGTAETNTALNEMQSVSSVSKVLQTDAGECVSSGMPLLNSDGGNVQNPEATCMESLVPVLKETSIALGGSGDSELCSVKNEMQASGRKPTETEEEKNDSTCEVIGKLTSDVLESSPEHLVS